MSKLSNESQLKTTRKYLQANLPKEDFSFTDEWVKRLEDMEKIYEMYTQDPFIDERMQIKLMRNCKTNAKELKICLRIFEMMVEELATTNKAVLRARLTRKAEQMIRQGDATGDWKPVDAGMKHIEKLHGLDLPDQAEDGVQQTYDLPPVIVSIDKIDPSRKQIGDKEFAALMKRYGGTRDEMEALIASMVAQDAEIVDEATADNNGEPEP